MIRPCQCRKIKYIAILVALSIGCLPAGNVSTASAISYMMYPAPAEGIASYYSYECASDPMANGKPFDPEKRTCASWFYEFGTVLIVKSLDTGLSTEVVVTDRGPNKRLVEKGRIIDLSKRAFQDIRQLKFGLTKVLVIVKK